MITAVPGIRVGHWTGPDTGVTVVWAPSGTVGSGEVRGGAPATRETALLEPTRLVERVDAVVLCGGSAFGLAAGLFTGDVAGAVRAIREIDAGNIHINWTPLWRADLMPYGGLKGSGIGKEGPRTAVAEMTEEKTVVLHGRPW